MDLFPESQPIPALDSWLSANPGPGFGFSTNRYEPHKAPSFARAVHGGRVIVVNSLSKTVMTGLRIGWLITTAERVKEFALLRRYQDHSCPAIAQATALEIFSSGRYDELVRFSSGAKAVGE